jgi:hypothetical protein
MRPVLVGACLGLLALSSGCGPFNNNKGGTVADATPRWTGTPKADQLVAVLNQNAQQLKSVEAKKVFLTAKVNNEHQGGMEGFLACQKAERPGTPPNFRLQADLLGTPRVDVGSNSDEFWFFIKDPARPYVVYYCSYADYPKVAARGAMPFPVQPEWVVEALGMAEYDPHQKYEVSAQSKETYDLVQRTKSPRGTEIVKVVAFHKTPRAGQSPVAAYILYETTNDAKQPYRMICSASIAESQAVPVGGGKTVPMPSTVRLNCPQEKTELTIELGKVQANVPFDQERSGYLFTRQALRNYKSYDLAQSLEAPASGVRPAGGVAR